MQKYFSKGWVFAYSVLGFALILFCSLFFSLMPFARKCSCHCNSFERKDFCNPNVGEASGASQFWTKESLLNAISQFTFVFLKPELSSTTVAYSRTTSGTNPPINAHGITPTLKWGFGFNVGIGTFFFHPDWGIDIDYGFFGARNSLQYNASRGREIIPQKGNSLNGQSVTCVDTELSLYLNKLLFMSKKQLHMPENIVILTGMGVKGSLLKLRQNTVYTGGSYLTNSEVKITEKQHSWAIGPRAGFETKWLFVNAFYLQGNLYSALQYSNNRMRYDENNTGNSDDRVQARDKIINVIPSMDLGLGLGFSDYVLGDDILSSITVMYQLEYNWRQNQQIQIQPYATPRYARSDSDISYQGVSLQIKFKW